VDAASRKANRVAFNEACDERLQHGPIEKWVERLNAAGIPAGPVYSIDQTFDDPQVRHLDVSETVTRVDRTDEPESVGVLRYPVTLEQTPASIRRGPPSPGIDTRTVLRDLGYDDDAIDALVASGAAAEQVGGESWLT
jgi:formyl-CoA transferase